MQLRAKGGPFTKHLFREIEALTDRAVLDVTSVRYHAEAEELTFRITRFPVLSRGKLTGRLTPFRIDRTRATDAVVTIRGVVSCRVENRLSSIDDPRVSLVLGIGVRGNQVVLGSVEEGREGQCFVLEATIGELDIEIRDLEPDR